MQYKRLTIGTPSGELNFWPRPIIANIPNIAHDIVADKETLLQTLEAVKLLKKQD